MSESETSTLVKCQKTEQSPSCSIVNDVQLRNLLKTFQKINSLVIFWWQEILITLILAGKIGLQKKKKVNCF